VDYSALAKGGLTLFIKEKRCSFDFRWRTKPFSHPSGGIGKVQLK